MKRDGYLTLVKESENHILIFNCEISRLVVGGFALEFSIEAGHYQQTGSGMATNAVLNLT